MIQFLLFVLNRVNDVIGDIHVKYMTKLGSVQQLRSFWSATVLLYPGRQIGRQVQQDLHAHT